MGGVVVVVVVVVVGGGGVVAVVYGRRECTAAVVVDTFAFVTSQIEHFTLLTVALSGMYFVAVVFLVTVYMCMLLYKVLCIEGKGNRRKRK